MTDTTRRRRRTWSAFGDLRRLPSEYEIGTHGANWTTRQGRKTPLEQDPSTPANRWLDTHRENSPLTVDDWDSFRDPDAMTYRRYVAMQSDQEAQVRGVLDKYSEAGADARLTPEWRATLARVFTPTRYPLHGFQQIHACFAYLAPSSYITNAATFAAADLLRRVSLVAYRTSELRMSWPDAGFATGERLLFENAEAWQPMRAAVESALVTYDWAEAFTAVDLVLLPTLDDLLLRQLGELARANGDELTWLLLSFLAADSKRRDRWSAALADYAITRRPGNAEVLRGWVAAWSATADDAVAGLATLLESLPGKPVDQAVAEVRNARLALHERIGLAGEAGHG
jgi:toluene monooxygenase system protein E